MIEVICMWLVQLTGLRNYRILISPYYFGPKEFVNLKMRGSHSKSSAFGDKTAAFWIKRPHD